MNHKSINLLLHIYLLALQVIVALDDDGLAEAGGGRHGQLQVSKAGYVCKKRRYSMYGQTVASIFVWLNQQLDEMRGVIFFSFICVYYLLFSWFLFYVYVSHAANEGRGVPLIFRDTTPSVSAVPQEFLS